MCKFVQVALPRFVQTFKKLTGKKFRSWWVERVELVFTLMGLLAWNFVKWLDRCDTHEISRVLHYNVFHSHIVVLGRKILEISNMCNSKFGRWKNRRITLLISRWLVVEPTFQWVCTVWTFCRNCKRILVSPQTVKAGALHMHSR